MENEEYIKNSNDNHKKVKVLIADDVKIIADKINNILIEDQRIEVLKIVENGTEEFNEILELKPDLVITDNQMPGLNGIEVIEKIANLDIENKPRFIMVTGDVYDFTLRNKAESLDVYRLVRKPVDEKILKDVIDEFIIEFYSKEDKEDVTDITIKKKVSIWKKILKFFKKLY